MVQQLVNGKREDREGVIAIEKYHHEKKDYGVGLRFGAGGLDVDVSSENVFNQPDVIWSRRLVSTR